MSALGYRHILVIIDYFTKFPYALPMRKKTSRHICHELYKLFSQIGFPEHIVTDRAGQLIGDCCKDLYEYFGIHKITTSSYHPQTNGLVERFNRTLVEQLAAVAHKHPDKWDYFIPQVLYHYRVSDNAATLDTPWFNLYKVDPVIPLDLAWHTSRTEPDQVGKQGYRAELIERSRVAADMMRENLMEAAAKAKRRFDKSRKPGEFQVGDRVFFLQSAAEFTARANQKQNKGKNTVPKFRIKWRGPARVVRKKQGNSYDLLFNGRTTPRNVKDLRPYDPFHTPQLPFVITEQRFADRPLPPIPLRRSARLKAKTKPSNT